MCVVSRSRSTELVTRDRPSEGTPEDTVKESFLSTGRLYLQVVIDVAVTVVVEGTCTDDGSASNHRVNVTRNLNRVPVLGPWTTNLPR